MAANLSRSRTLSGTGRWSAGTGGIRLGSLKGPRDLLVLETGQFFSRPALIISWWLVGQLKVVICDCI